MSGSASSFDDYEDLQSMVHMLRLSLQAEHVEVVANLDPPVVLTSGNRCGNLLDLDGIETSVETIGELANEHPSYGSYIIVPMKLQDDRSGWIAASGARTKPFTDTSKVFMRAVARSIARAVAAPHHQSTVRELQLDLDRARHSARRLERSHRACSRNLEQLAYIASHEFLAPLRPVKLYAESLRAVAEGSGDVDEAVLEESTAKICGGIAQMHERLSELQSFSATSLQMLQVERCETNEIVEEAIAAVSTSLDACGATMSVDDLPTVVSQKVPLASVFVTLFANCIRFRHEERSLHIRVSAERAGSNTVISVADTGLDAGEDDGHRMFEIFEGRGDHPEESGVALALSRQIIESSGGNLGVRPGTTGGVVFWIRLPTAQDSVALSGV